MVHGTEAARMHKDSHPGHSGVSCRYSNHRKDMGYALGLRITKRGPARKLKTGLQAESKTGRRSDRIACPYFLLFPTESLDQKIAIDRGYHHMSLEDIVTLSPFAQI